MRRLVHHFIWQTSILTVARDMHDPNVWECKDKREFEQTVLREPTVPVMVDFYARQSRRAV